ncbi:MAG: M23 family metallopeptidase [Granulosicoccaceae bacterium]
MLRSKRRVRTLVNYTAKYGLTLCTCMAVVGAGITGYRVGQDKPDIIPAVIVAASYQAPEIDFTERRNAQLGRIKAEVIALQVQFSRLAEVADLHDGEFELDADPLLFVEEPVEPADEASLLIEQIDHMNNEALVLEKIFIERRIAHDHRISGTPLVGGTRSSGYGYRLDPVSGKQTLHRGVDYRAEAGTPIYSLADGVVSYSGWNGDYGNLVEIDHGAGYRTRYAHNKANLVDVGKRVSKNQMIATLGSTGKSTGAHVHLEVRYQGRAVDPGIFIR